MSITAPLPSQTDPTLEFVGLYADQTESVILGRLIDWANEGLDPVADADAWVDTREGSHWRTCITPVVQEFARIYDMTGTEVPMSGFVLWAWGSYLDDLAAVWDVYRLAATYATGVVTFTGDPGTDVDGGTTVSAAPATADDPAPTFSVTIGGTIAGGGTVDLAIQATDAGSTGDVAAGAITQPSTPLPDGVTFTNAAATDGGLDPETDDALRTRVLQATAGKGPGAVSDYIRWATAWAGVGHVQVVPVWDGPGTVLVMVTDAEGLPVSSAIFDGLQTDLDPVSGQGQGTAPVGAIVTVDTSDLLDITPSGTVDFEEGYSWDGFGNTVAVGARILAAQAAYLLTVPPGGEVVIAQMQGIVATWPGVHDVTVFELNGVDANVAVGLTPPQVAQLVDWTPT